MISERQIDKLVALWKSKGWHGLVHTVPELVVEVDLVDYSGVDHLSEEEESIGGLKLSYLIIGNHFLNQTWWHKMQFNKGRNQEWKILILIQGIVRNDFILNLLQIILFELLSSSNFTISRIVNKQIDLIRSQSFEIFQTFVNNIVL